MKIKAKLTIGVGLLFFMILALALLSGWYITQLKNDTNNILVANYNTLEYSRNMLLALENIHLASGAFGDFETNLNKQKGNVTEQNEQATTNRISEHFGLLRQQPANTELQSVIRRDITELMRLNMAAIERKSRVADGTAEKAIFVISIVGTGCFLIAFVVLVNLPGSIANPIKDLTASIKQISNQNYKERVHFETHNEFGELAQSFNTMAAKLQEYSDSKLDKIIKGKKRIEILINNMHDPVIGINEKRKILFVNNEALKITGMKQENIIGKPIQDIALHNDLIRNIALEIVSETQVKDTEPIKIFADNKESYFEKEIIDINMTPTGEKEQQFIGQVILLRNITPFKELDIAKTNFIANVSHELKTPISSIKMGLQLLENKKTGELSSEQRQLIEGIADDTDRLLRITGELLNMTQVESGTIQMNMISVDIQNIIDYAVNANRTIAEHKQITITKQIPESVSRVLCDFEKTAWVLSNLVSNAVRYSHENSIVELRIEAVNNHVVFSVCDTGQGIEPQYINRIFDRYFRIPGSRKEGTGLGLSISKEFIEAQGGEITVKSDYGAGSEFSFYLKA